MITTIVTLGSIETVAIVNGVFGFKGLLESLLQDKSVLQILLRVLVSCTTTPRNEIIVA
jgi:hypothetical protein